MGRIGVETNLPSRGGAQKEVMGVVQWHKYSSISSQTLHVNLAALRNNLDLHRFIYAFLPKSLVGTSYFANVRIYVYDPLAPPWGELNLYGTGFVVHPRIIAVYWDPDEHKFETLYDVSLEDLAGEFDDDSYDLVNFREGEFSLYRRSLY